MKASSFGGTAFCCVVCPDDTSKICCPSKGETGAPVTLRLDGSDPYNKVNLCSVPGTGGEDVFILAGVETQGPKLSMVIKNVTEYSPTWPQVKANNPGKLSPVKGYMFNGRKSADKVVDDILQLNLCNKRYVTMQSCFEDAESQAVTMERATIRIYDVDHGKNSAVKGPEVFQFKCRGGTFSIYGDTPAMMHLSHTAGQPSKIDKNYTANGQTRTTFDCPDDEFVTMWSGRSGVAADNPDNISALSPLQELSMVSINFTNVQCFNMTFANMPPSYHQNRWPMASRADGGNPLNSSLELNLANFDDLDMGECPPAEIGRNWMVSGLYDVGRTAPCRGTTFDDPHVQTLSGSRFYMHGVGVFDYASSGHIESQVYLCPFAHCTDKMMASGECLTFIQAVAVKTAKHTLVFRHGKLLVDGKDHPLGANNLTRRDFVVSAVGAQKLGADGGPRINHKDLAGCHPDPASSTDGWLWNECTKHGWRFESAELGISIGALGPFEKGWLNEKASDRTFNLDVFNVSRPSQVRGIINGDVNGAFRDAGSEHTNTLGIYNAPQVTADNVAPQQVIFPKRVVREMDEQCGGSKPLSAMPMSSGTMESLRLMRHMLPREG